MTNLTPLAKLPTTTNGRSPAPRRPAPLNRKQKAAIIVRFLLNEQADLPISALPEDLQADLTHQLGEMRLVDRDTLESVVREFADQLESVGLSFPGDIAGALSILDGKISPQTAARLRREAGVRQIGDPWERIRGLPVEELLNFATQESTEVAAVMLSKLEVPKAAELLGNLPGEKARRITYAVSLTGAVTPEAVDRIGISLASQLDNKPLRAFDEEPVKRVGAILNFSASATRDDVLTGLDEADSDFANKVRKAIFTFADISTRLDPIDVPKITREVDQAVLVRALTAAGQMELAETAEFILANMSKRMSQALQEEMEEVGTIKQKDGEEAMSEVVRAIRALEAAGDLVLHAGDEEED